MKMKKFKALLLAVPFLLTGCVRNNGLCYTHTDADGDGICDVCGAEVPLCPEHKDENNDGFCDLCGAHMPTPPGPVNPCATHTDKDMDGKCDVCGADMSTPEHTHIDSVKDGKCDICGATMTPCTTHLDQDHDGYCDYCGTKMDVPLGKVTTYLVLSSVGRYKGQVGTTDAEKHLENVVKYEADVGTALPGKDEITHAYGSATFESWLCYEGLGAPTVYTTVPNAQGKILYANFVANGSDPVKPDPDPDPQPKETYTYTLLTSFNNGQYNWSQDGAQIFVHAWNNNNDAKSYKMTKVDDGKFTVDLPQNYYTGLLFARAPSDATSLDWNTLWNKTSDMTFESGKFTAQIDDWGHATWVA